MSELDVNNRVPNPKYMEHYEFELEVLAVNETRGVNIFAFCIPLFHYITNIFIYYLFLVERNCENNNRLGWTYIWV